MQPPPGFYPTYAAATILDADFEKCERGYLKGAPKMSGQMPRNGVKWNELKPPRKQRPRMPWIRGITPCRR